MSFSSGKSATTNDENTHERLVQLCERLENYGSTSEAGGLKRCEEWTELRRLLGTQLH
jgi:hypothetical protein